MHCDHKRVWEIKIWDTNSLLGRGGVYTILGEVLLQGYEPYAVEDGVHFLKRLTPCQTCASLNSKVLGVAGEQIAPGDILYVNSEDKKLYVVKETLAP